MSAEATLEAKGLWTNTNSLTGIPPGGTTRQQNMRIHRPGLMTPRRGRKSICSLQSAFYRVFDSGDYLIGFAADRSVYISSDNGVTWTQLLDWSSRIAAVNPVWGERQYFGINLNDSFFFTSDDGIKQANSTDMAHRPAGVPPGLNAKVTSLTAAGTAVPVNSRVGYRAVFGLREPNGSVNLSAPSQRAIAVNDTNSIVNPTVEIVVPPGVIPSKHFWQLYRTYPSPDAAADPGDEMSLIFEGEIPLAFTTDTIVRADNVATLHSPTPHGLSLGQAINLDGSIVDIPFNGIAGDSMAADVVNSGGTGILRRYLYEFGAATAQTNISIGNYDAGHVYGSGFVHPANRRWMNSPQLGCYILVHPQLDNT